MDHRDLERGESTPNQPQRTNLQPALVGSHDRAERETTKQPVATLQFGQRPVLDPEHADAIALIKTANDLRPDSSA
jgi:hypothetical protein